MEGRKPTQAGALSPASERENQRKWRWLGNELKEGVRASESEFFPLDVEILIAEARPVRKSDYYAAGPDVLSGKSRRDGGH